MNFYKKSKIIVSLYNKMKHQEREKRLSQFFEDMKHIFDDQTDSDICSSNISNINMSELFEELNDRVMKFAEKLQSVCEEEIYIEKRFAPAPVEYHHMQDLHYYMSDLWKRIRIPSHDPLFGYQPQSIGDDPCDGCPSKGKEFCNCTLGDPKIT